MASVSFKAGATIHINVYSSPFWDFKMKKVGDILKLIKLVILSGYIKGEKPLSSITVGEHGTGKTEMNIFHKSNKLLVTTDVTYRGLLDELEKNSKITHIIIPDLLKITQKRKSTSDNLVSLLNALVEEGVGKITMYNYNKDFKGRVCGLITATTKASFNQNRKRWKSFGFLSRMIIISFSYTDKSIKEIMDFINEESHKLEKKFERVKGYKQVEVISEKELNKQLNKIAGRSFRQLKHLQTLCKSHAVLRGDNKVIQQDVDEIKRLSRFINLNFTKI